jgi:hypothetical protein
MNLMLEILTFGAPPAVSTRYRYCTFSSSVGILIVSQDGFGLRFRSGSVGVGDVCREGDGRTGCGGRGYIAGRLLVSGEVKV